MFPAPNSMQRVSSGKKEPRAKVALKPGHSLMDWIRHANSNVDVQGFMGRIRAVTEEELAKHNTRKDCWMSVRGHVYNVSAYMDYHPGGGDELMRGAGKDATQLFDEIHKWVNIQSMLAKCYIGPLKATIAPTKPKKTTANTDGKDGFLSPNGPNIQKPLDVKPRYDWFQKDDHIIIAIYTKSKVVEAEDVLLDAHGGHSLAVKILMGDKFFCINLALEAEVTEAKVLSVSGTKIQLSMRKKDASKRWSSLGLPLENHNQLLNEADKELKHHICQVSRVSDVTHNTKLFTIRLPDMVHYITPIGYHVVFQADVQGMSIGRSYTVALPSLSGTEESTLGELTFMIKIYPDGALTPVLDKLSVGDTISVSECTGNFKRNRLKEASKVFMIAAGTGFTPMIRLLRYYLVDKKTECNFVKLLFANRREEDILWKEHIEDLAQREKKFRATYILSEPPCDTWSGLSGRVTKEILQTFMTETVDTRGGDENPGSPVITLSISSDDVISKPSIPDITQSSPVINGEGSGESETLIAICGPDEFTKTVHRFLLDLGFAEGSIHCFLG